MEFDPHRRSSGREDHPGVVGHRPASLPDRDEVSRADHCLFHRRNRRWQIGLPSRVQRGCVHATYAPIGSLRPIHDRPVRPAPRPDPESNVGRRSIAAIANALCVGVQYHARRQRRRAESGSSVRRCRMFRPLAVVLRWRSDLRQAEIRICSGSAAVTLMPWAAASGPARCASPGRRHEPHQEAMAGSSTSHALASQPRDQLCQSASPLGLRLTLSRAPLHDAPLSWAHSRPLSSLTPLNTASARLSAGIVLANSCDSGSGKPSGRQRSAHMTDGRRLPRTTRTATGRGDRRSGAAPGCLHAPRSFRNSEKR